MLWRRDQPTGQSSAAQGTSHSQPYATQRPHARPMGAFPSSSDYTHVATEEAPGGLHAKHSSGRFPPEAAQWQCGEQRLALRQKFNMKEIDAAQLMRRYDADHSKLLEPGEVRHLLRDYNDGRSPKEEELDFIMKVSDKNHDHSISQEEIAFALRAWYAFRNMPKSVGHAFSKHRLGNGPLPPLEAMREVLLSLNEHQPVSADEAAFVRSMAFNLGGSDGHVTLEQLRQAVAAWYLHIERGDTGQADLVTKSAVDVHKKVFGMASLRALLHGECKYSGRGTLILGGVMFAVLMVVPCLEILMANTFPTTYRCQHPHMSSLLWSTGVLKLLLAFGIVGAVAASHYGAASVQIFLWVFVTTVGVICTVVTVLGASDVLWSSSARCGLALWHFAHLVWIEVPALLVIFACCALPTMYCIMGSQEFIKNQELDEGLMRP
mmetsp:Transcript_25190/g.79402  ORF Transcript_25190/g.79402 Transcript_25190/m.79402 type:complete len:435 (-) Transcript_25190:150-1454(-)